MNKRHPKISILVSLLALLALACSLPFLGGANNDTQANNTSNAPEDTTENDAAGEDAGDQADDSDGLFETQLTGTCTNNYYPIIEGRTWHYLITTPDQPDLHMYISYADVDQSGFTQIQEFDDYRGEVRWVCGENGVISTEYANIALSANYISFDTLAYDGVLIPTEAQMVVGGSWASAFEIFATYDIEGVSGETNMHLTFNNTGEAMESVSVPYGSFADALRAPQNGEVVSEIMVNGVPAGEFTIAFNSTNWYVRGVGLVRSLSTMTDDLGLFGGMNSEMALIDIE
jgi:hypothetical protein